MDPTPTPAYLVCHTRTGQQTTRQFFTHNNLLTARKAAFTFIESLFADRLDEYLEQDELELSLVEITGPNDPTPSLIAQMLNKQKYADLDSAEYRNEGERKLRELNREFTYYQTHTHSVGFGAFGLRLRLLRQPDPEQELTVLADAIGSVMATIDSYNSGWDIHFSFAYYQPNDPIETIVLIN